MAPRDYARLPRQLTGSIWDKYANTKENGHENCLIEDLIDIRSQMSLSITQAMSKARGAEMKLLTYARSIVGRTWSACRGQSLVEFAMVAPLFFILVFGITDFGRLFFTQQTLQFALREAGRYAVTGQHMKVGTNTLSRVESIRSIAQKYAVGLLTDPAAIQISSGGTTNYAGGPSDTVVVSLETKLKLITPLIGQFFGSNGVYDFTVSTTFKNEPFDQSDTN